MDNRILLRNAEEMRQAVEQVADAIISEFGAGELHNVSLLGLYKAGVPLAKRIAEVIKKRTGVVLQFGTLDISMYRDDIGNRARLPLIRETRIPFDVNDKFIILVDDVLSTGRTIRAALDALTDYGRPRRIRLAVLVDRGEPEFPIRADFAGFNLSVPADHKIKVFFAGDASCDPGIYDMKWPK